MILQTQRGAAGGLSRSIQTIVNRSTARRCCAFATQQSGVNWSNLRTLHGLHIPVHINRQYDVKPKYQPGPVFTNIVAVQTSSDSTFNDEFELQNLPQLTQNTI